MARHRLRVRQQQVGDISAAFIGNFGCILVDLFCYNRRALVTAAKKVLIWPQKTRTVASGHESAITCALFNPLFNLVVSGDEESLVTLWDLESGSPMFRFKNCHGLQKITAMAFDKTARRLVTAGHMDPEGVVKVWNFSTRPGAHHRDFL